MTAETEPSEDPAVIIRVVRNADHETAVRYLNAVLAAERLRGKIEGGAEVKAIYHKVFGEPKS